MIHGKLSWIAPESLKPKAWENNEVLQTQDLPESPECPLQYGVEGEDRGSGAALEAWLCGACRTGKMFPSHSGQSSSLGKSVHYNVFLFVSLFVFLLLILCTWMWCKEVVKHLAWSSNLLCSWIPQTPSTWACCAAPKLTVGSQAPQAAIPLAFISTHYKSVILSLAPVRVMSSLCILNVCFEWVGERKIIVNAKQQ